MTQCADQAVPFALEMADVDADLIDVAQGVLEKGVGKSPAVQHLLGQDGVSEARAFRHSGRSRGNRTRRRYSLPRAAIPGDGAREARSDAG